MIRSRTKIYAEPNNPDTATISRVVGPGKYLVVGGTSGKRMLSLSASPNTVFYVKSDGSVAQLLLQPNTVIGTNSFGEIILIDRSTL